MGNTDKPTGRPYVWPAILVFCVAVGIFSATVGPASSVERGHYGFLSILAAVATLVICFATRNVILALIMSNVVGGTFFIT